MPEVHNNLTETAANTSVSAEDSFQIDITPMTAEEARECAEAIKGNLESLRSMLLDLQRRRGWEALGYSSWRECATSEFRQSQAYVYRLVQAAEVEENLVSSQISTIVETDSIPINQLSELAKLPPDQQAEGLQKANEFAIAEGKPRTAVHVARAVRGIKKPTSGAPTDSTEVDIPSSSTDGSKDEQYTPRKILDAVLECFGRIALDPCSNSHTNPNVPADRHFSKEDNGLDQDWDEDNAFINPPYSNPQPWILKTVEEINSERLTEAIALISTDTSTEWFDLIWEHAAAVCFVKRRLKFVNSANTSPARFASAIVYFGLDVQTFYKAFHGKIGRCVMPMFENAPTEAQWKTSEEKRLELLETLKENLLKIQQLENERDQAISEADRRQRLITDLELENLIFKDEARQLRGELESLRQKLDLQGANAPTPTSDKSLAPPAPTIIEDPDENIQDASTTYVVAEESEVQALELKPLTSLGLADRLGVNNSNIGRNKEKSKEHFRDWSAQKDPDGIAWEYRPGKNRSPQYHPIID